MSQLIIHLVRFRPPINLFNAISSIILICSPTLRCCSLIGRGWGPDSGASQVWAESSNGGKKTKDVWFSVQKVSSFNLRHYILLCRARRRGGKSCSTLPWSGLLEPSSLLEESLDNIQTLEHYKHGDGNKRSFYIIYQLLNCSTTQPHKPDHQPRLLDKTSANISRTAVMIVHKLCKLMFILNKGRRYFKE